MRLLPASFRGQLIVLLAGAIAVSELIAVGIVVGDRNFAETFAFDSRAVSQTVTAFGLAADTTREDGAVAVRRVSSREQIFFVVPDLPELPKSVLTPDLGLAATLSTSLASDGHTSKDVRAGAFSGLAPPIFFAAMRPPPLPGSMSADGPISSQREGTRAPPLPALGAEQQYLPQVRLGLPPGGPRGPRGAVGFGPFPGPGGLPNESGYLLSAKLPSGDWLVSIARRPPSIWPLVGRASLAALAIALVVLGIAAIIAGLIVRPINRLTAALATLGRGEYPPALALEGPEDVRAAIAAFNSSSSTIARTITAQQRMLAAVGHDLATPLTALRLRAESVEEQDVKQRMIALIEEMQTLTQDVLTLAREATPREENRTVNLVSLVDSLCQDLHDLALHVNFEAAPAILWRGRSNSLRRALRNLIENACQYGETANIDLRQADSNIIITIDDEGPGIPRDRLADVLNPFVRLEQSRNRRTGGSGLGLPIAQTIIESLGGTLTLANRDEGGLRVRVTLPLSAPSKTDPSKFALG